MKCRQQWCTMMCSACNVIFYCSKICQKIDWPIHKKYCKKVTDEGMPKKGSALTDSEKLVVYNMKRRQQKDNEQNSRNAMGKTHTNRIHLAAFQNFTGPRERLFASISPDRLTIHERPSGSLAKALRYARTRFSGCVIIESFDNIAVETHELSALYRQSMNNLLVAFMFMYHDHRMRHGVFLKDSGDKITHLEFYFDHLGDNPWPFFNFAEVRPGHYILIKNPLMHLFADGQVGLRINDPAEVQICGINNLQ